MAAGIFTKENSMIRRHVSWSNFTDLVEGPCVVCGKEVQYVIPADRPSPVLLYHATCDPMGALRERLKTATPPPLPADQTIRFKSGHPTAPPAAASTGS